MFGMPNGRSAQRRVLAPIALACAMTPLLAAGAHAASPVSLGSAESYALLGGSTITNTGPTTITGDIGLCCSGLATPGFGSVTQPRGAQYVGPGSEAATAQDDLDIAYLAAAGQAVSNTVGVDLSLAGTPANPLTPGVYESTSHGAFQINTGLTLDFQGDPNAVFIFQGTDLVTAAGAGGSVSIVNGGATPSTCNVMWQLSDATQGVTLGTDSAFKGTTMSLGASVLGSGATVEGRILTRNSKAVTLDTNTITQTACFSDTAGGGGGGGGGGGTTPPPGGGGAGGAHGTGPAHPATPLVAQVAATSTPAAVTPGSAQLSGPTGPVDNPFRVTVTGHAIAQVVFYVDGRRVGTVRAKRGRTKFIITINPRTQNHRVHRVTAKVTFTKKSRTRKATRRLTYRRSPAALQAPRFAG
jgi:hypothetical protein